MDTHHIFCSNLDCPARGQTGKGNIGSHSRIEGRYECSLCKETFAATKGTPFYRCRTPAETITRVVTLVAHGCPIEAIVAAWGFQARTVRRWVEAAGQHAQRIHHHRVARPPDLKQVQAEEIRLKMQRCLLWIAMALAVPSRLWLGGVLSPVRDKALIGPW